MKRASLLILGVFAAAALAQIPPGFEVVYLRVNRPFHRDPAINNLGHVVFAAARDSFGPSTADLFYYDGTTITQLTNDSVADALPCINDYDEIVWSKEIGTGASVQLMHWDNGAISQLTNDSTRNEGARINNAGQIAWCQWIGQGCANTSSNIMLFDGDVVHSIIADGLSNQAPSINELGEIAWTRYDFCNSQWSSEILTYQDGQIIVVTTDQLEPQSANIADDGSVAWYYYVPQPIGQDAIQIWRNGVTATLTGWGSGLAMNGRGDVAFDRWYDDSQTWQVHLYLNGQFYQITSGSEWSYVEGINDLGEVVFVSGNPPYNTRIGLLRRMRGRPQLHSMDSDSGGAKYSGFGG